MRLLVLLAALLASAPRSDAQHVNFYRMSSNGCATGVKSDTGYSAPVIKYVWRKYRAQLINAARGVPNQDAQFQRLRAKRELVAGAAALFLIREQ